MREHRKPLHTTLSDETTRFIERKSEELGLSKGATIDWLVQKHKHHGAELKKSVLKEVVEYVFTEYLDHID